MDYQSKRLANIIKINPEDGPDIKELKDYLTQGSFEIEIEL
ncbi:hypothetical protein BDD43_1316 [Mucilaginibacter gracilis]|uniref:Uncharacterized protein n=1 Tax=Mucilaginibacter gracilis TaxID=423350 RepID=A0A495IX57_9SPHI|nr:hypothetical protein [Mucilaginibacter gracilis]RKR81172.1 hypothetical protein BDD43_1316 [Mucilaginibacter gracilis]